MAGHSFPDVPSLDQIRESLAPVLKEAGAVKAIVAGSYARGDANQYSDLAATRSLLRDDFFAQACFMSHQVAEKALKALAYHRGDRFVTGHLLTELVARLESTYSDVSDFRRLASTLDRYYGFKVL